MSDVTAARVKQVRKLRDWSTADLAACCRDLGAADLTENVIENIESGRRGKDGRRRRDVTVDELLALGLALNVAPVHLLVPVDDFRKSYRITGGVSDKAGSVREWIRGIMPLPRGADPRKFFGQVPRTEYHLANQAVSWPVPSDDQEVSDGEH